MKSCGNYGTRFRHAFRIFRRHLSIRALEESRHERFNHNQLRTDGTRESGIARHAGMLCSGMEAFQSPRNVPLTVSFSSSRHGDYIKPKTRFALVVRDKARTHATRTAMYPNSQSPCDIYDPSILLPSLLPGFHHTPPRPLTSSKLSGTSDPTHISPVQLLPLLVQCLFELRGYGV